MFKKIIFLLIFMGLKYAYAQEGPKNIISDKKSNLIIEKDDLIEADNNPIEERILPNPEADVFNGVNESDNKTELERESIVIEDLPNRFNSWNGILSSDKNGLGWMMWEDIDYQLSKNLISIINPSLNSPTLSDLLKNFLLSRAKGPLINSTNENAIQKSRLNDKFPFLSKKIEYLVYLGQSEYIEKLLDTIPLDLKTPDLLKENFNLRFESLDVPYICNNVSKMLSHKENLTLYRKVLIVCKLIQNKKEEAMLAIELLENDILEEDVFLNDVREHIKAMDDDSQKSLMKTSNDSNLLKILAFYNYKYAKKNFENEPRIFHKTVYDMKLFTKQIQVESLEFLVNQGIYSHELLIEEYKTIVKEKNLSSYIDNQSRVKTDNNVQLRATYFNIINNSISDIEKARNIMTLWELGKENDILKAISLITKNTILSLSPDQTLNWFNLTAFKVLLLTGEIEESKKWLFYGTSDIEERAGLDINYCRHLILLYIYDSNVKDLNNKYLDINYFLTILSNDLNLDDDKFLLLVLTLTAFGEDVPSNMWERFLEIKKLGSELIFFRNNVSSYFMLENAISKKKLAQGVLISVNLLQSEKGMHKKMYDFYIGLKGLNEIGLEKYAREYAIEKNYNFLTK